MLNLCFGISPTITCTTFPLILKKIEVTFKIRKQLIHIILINTEKTYFTFQSMVFLSDYHVVKLIVFGNERRKDHCNSIICVFIFLRLRYIGHCPIEPATPSSLKSRFAIIFSFIQICNNPYKSAKLSQEVV